MYCIRVLLCILPSRPVLNILDFNSIYMFTFLQYVLYSSLSSPIILIYSHLFLIILFVSLIKLIIMYITSGQGLFMSLLTSLSSFLLSFFVVPSFTCISTCLSVIDTQTFFNFSVDYSISTTFHQLQSTGFVPDKGLCGQNIALLQSAVLREMLDITTDM